MTAPPGPMPRICHERVRADGVTLHVAVCGEGPPVLLLHGFPENWRSWTHQFPPLVAAGFSVWAPDLRGYNESDRPRERQAYTLAHLTADVAALVEKTGARRAHVGGHDWGGVIAWEFAAAYPELIDRLMIFNAPHPELYFSRILQREQRWKSSYVLLFLLPGIAERVLAANDYRALRRLFERTPARPGTFATEEVGEYVRAMSAPGALTAALNYYRANVSLSVSGRRALRKVDCDTLVVWGERDVALSTILLDGLDQVAPRVRVHRLPDVGHWVNNEAADEVNRLILEFLR